eukprot:PhM_4_TR15179/c2_g2_i2/m.67062
MFQRNNQIQGFGGGGFGQQQQQQPPQDQQGGFMNSGQQQQYNNNNNNNNMMMGSGMNQNNMMMQGQQSGQFQQGYGPGGMMGMQQPSMCPCCAPQQPGAGGCCDIDAPPTPKDQSMCAPAYQYCDHIVWMITLLVLLSLVGFAVVLGTVKPDDLYGVYDLEVSNSAGLNAALYWDVTPNRLAYEEWYLANQSKPTAPPTTPPCRTPTCPPCQTVGPSVTPTPTPPTAASNAASRHRIARRLLNATVVASSFEEFEPGPYPTPKCVGSKSIFGLRGTLCRGNSMTAEQFLLDISRWVNFRAMLYFMILLGSIVAAVYARLIFRVQNTDPMAPIDIDHTPVHAMIMVSWYVTGFFVFFLVCNEMHSYWSVVEFYKSNSMGKLKGFWDDFDTKFVPSVVMATIVLCWPFIWGFAQIGVFIAFVIPWKMFTMMCVQQLSQMPPDRKPVPWQKSCREWSDLPLVVRLDVWFSEFHRASRYGFGQLSWELITGKREGALFQQPGMGTMGGAAMPGFQPGMNSMTGTRRQSMQEGSMGPGSELHQQPSTTVTMEPSGGIDNQQPKMTPAPLNASQLGSSSLRRSLIGQQPTPSATTTPTVVPTPSGGDASVPAPAAADAKPTVNMSDTDGDEDKVARKHSSKRHKDKDKDKDKEGADGEKKPKREKSHRHKDKDSKEDGEDGEKKPKREKSHRHKDKDDKDKDKDKEKDKDREKRHKEKKEKKEREKAEAEKQAADAAAAPPS